MANFLDELNQVATPEQLAAFGHSHEEDGSSGRYVGHPTKELTFLVEPGSPAGNPRGEVQYVIDKAIVHLSKGNSHVQRLINSDERRISRGMAEYAIRFIRASQGSREASSHLRRLHEFFTRDGGDGRIDYKELLRAVDVFAREGNPFKLMEESSASSEAMLSRVEHLKHKYKNAIGCEKLRRTMTAVTFGLATVGLVILSVIQGPVAAVYGPVILSMKGATDVMEVSRKVKEDAIKEKSKVIPKMEEVFSLGKECEEDRAKVSSEYKKFLSFVEEVAEKIKSAIEDERGGGVPIARKVARDVAAKATDLMGVVGELEEKEEKFKTKATATEDDPAVTDVMDDLGKINPRSSNKGGGLFRKLFAKMKKDN